MNSIPNPTIKVISAVPKSGSFTIKIKGKIIKKDNFKNSFKYNKVLEGFCILKTQALIKEWFS